MSGVTSSCDPLPLPQHLTHSRKALSIPQGGEWAGLAALRGELQRLCSAVLSKRAGGTAAWRVVAVTEPQNLGLGGRRKAARPGFGEWSQEL